MQIAVFLLTKFSGGGYKASDDLIPQGYTRWYEIITYKSTITNSQFYYGEAKTWVQ